MNGRVLIIDDDQSMCELIDESLSQKGYKTEWRTSADEGFRLLDGQDFDAVLTDLNMRHMNGLDLCERIVSSRPDVPVVVVTAFGSMETAIGAIRAGAYDFVTKPVEMDALALVVERAVQHPFRKALFAFFHDGVDAPRYHQFVVKGIRYDFPFDYFSSTRHFDYSVLSFGTFGAVLGPALFAVFHALRVERAAHNVIANARQVFHAAAADKHYGVFLQVVADAGNVGGNFKPVRKPYARNLAQGRVRFFRRRRVNASADPAPLRTARKRRALRFRPDLFAALSDELINSRQKISS